MTWGSVTERAEDDEVFVRPISYVEDGPVARRVGDRELYIGNHLAASDEVEADAFRYVLSLTKERRSRTTHHHPLTDGPGNEWAAFRDAVDAARDLSRRDGALLVHCKSGVSRSSTVLAAALAAEEDVSFRTALTTVQRARPIATPHPALHELAVLYLAADA